MADEDKKKIKKKDIGVEITNKKLPGYMNQPHYKEYIKRLYESQLSKKGLTKT